MLAAHVTLEYGTSIEANDIDVLLDTFMSTAGGGGGGGGGASSPLMLKVGKGTLTMSWCYCRFASQ